MLLLQCCQELQKMKCTHFYFSHHLTLFRYYLKAQAMMAHIYLHHKNDKRMYVNCYKRLVDSNPTVHAYMMLGDALMRIQEVKHFTDLTGV